MLQETVFHMACVCLLAVAVVDTNFPVLRQYGDVANKRLCSTEVSVTE